MLSFTRYIPNNSIEKINFWISKTNSIIRVSKKRSTKLGDFKVVSDKLYISVNKDLNKYAFLLTLTHELAHAFTYINYKNTVLPHGKEWKNIFQYMLLELLEVPIFPQDITTYLKIYAKNPKASTLSDINLYRALSNYDQIKSITISDIARGKKFTVHNKCIYTKGTGLRKNIKCYNNDNGRIYLFHPLTKIKLLD
tara:strand:- start:241 stop:828 length:588 start_codon:yes stop_codon:yes gene_type:complete